MLKNIRWSLIALAVSAFVITTILGNFYHPWDEVLENSAAGVLDFGVLEDASSSQTMEGKDFWDRVDVMKAEIGRFLFSDSTPGVLGTIAHSILSPIEDTAKSVSLAISYSGFLESHTPDPFYSALILITFFLLYYGFLFGKDKILTRVHAKNPVEEYVVGYCVEGVSAFLCLFVTYWVIMGLGVLRRLGIFQIFYGGMSSGNALIVIPSAILLVCVLIFLLIMMISLFICVMPYYCMMALPVMLAAVLPLWIWLRLVICLVLEVVIIVKVFPWLFERLNLWNVVSLLTRIVLFIPRTIYHLFT